MSETLRRALADFHEADESDFDTIPLEEVARELADRVSSELANTDIVDLSEHVREDVTSGATFVPVVHNGMVGYRCQHPDGREVFIYFNPSDDSDDGQANVFLYEGEHFDPSKDSPSHHYDIEWPNEPCAPCADGEHATVEDGRCTCCGAEVTTDNNDSSEERTT